MNQKLGIRRSLVFALSVGLFFADPGQAIRSHAACVSHSKVVDLVNAPGPMKVAPCSVALRQTPDWALVEKYAGRPHQDRLRVQDCITPYQFRRKYPT
jgi:hypothetical protein